METTEMNEPLVPAEPIELKVLQDGQYYLLETGKWARFLGIMGFIGAGIVLLAAVFISTLLSLLPVYGPTQLPGFFGGILGFIYVTVAVIAFIISLNLYQFGKNIKQAVVFKDSLKLSLAFNKLKTFFKIKAIIIIIF